MALNEIKTFSKIKIPKSKYSFKLKLMKGIHQQLNVDKWVVQMDIYEGDVQTRVGIDTFNSIKTSLEGNMLNVGRTIGDFAYWAGGKYQSIHLDRFHVEWGFFFSKNPLNEIEKLNTTLVSRFNEDDLQEEPPEPHKVTDVEIQTLLSKIRAFYNAINTIDDYNKAKTTSSNIETEIDVVKKSIEEGHFSMMDSLVNIMNTVKLEFPAFLIAKFTPFLDHAVSRISYPSILQAMNRAITSLILQYRTTEVLNNLKPSVVFDSIDVFLDFKTLNTMIDNVYDDIINKKPLDDARSNLIVVKLRKLIPLGIDSSFFVGILKRITQARVENLNLEMLAILKDKKYVPISIYAKKVIGDDTATFLADLERTLHSNYSSDVFGKIEKYLKNETPVDALKNEVIKQLDNALDYVPANESEARGSLNNFISEMIEELQAIMRQEKYKPVLSEANERKQAIERDLHEQFKSKKSLNEIMKRTYHDDNPLNILKQKYTKEFGELLETLLKETQKFVVGGIDLTEGGELTPEAILKIKTNLATRANRLEPGVVVLYIRMLRQAELLKDALFKGDDVISHVEGGNLLEGISQMYYSTNDAYIYLQVDDGNFTITTNFREDVDKDKRLKYVGFLSKNYIDNQATTRKDSVNKLMQKLISQNIIQEKPKGQKQLTLDLDEELEDLKPAIDLSKITDPVLYQKTAVSEILNKVNYKTPEEITAHYMKLYENEDVIRKAGMDFDELVMMYYYTFADSELETVPDEQLKFTVFRLMQEIDARKFDDLRTTFSLLKNNDKRLLDIQKNTWHSLFSQFQRSPQFPFNHFVLDYAHLKDKQNETIESVVQEASHHFTYDLSGGREPKIINGRVIIPDKGWIWKGNTFIPQITVMDAKIKRFTNQDAMAVFIEHDASVNFQDGTLSIYPVLESSGKKILGKEEVKHLYGALRSPPFARSNEFNPANFLIFVENQLYSYASANAINESERFLKDRYNIVIGKPIKTIRCYLSRNVDKAKRELIEDILWDRLKAVTYEKGFYIPVPFLNTDADMAVFIDAVKLADRRARENKSIVEWFKKKPANENKRIEMDEKIIALDRNPIRPYEKLLPAEKAKLLEGGTLLDRSKMEKVLG